MHSKINIGGGHSWKTKGWDNLDITHGYDIRTCMLKDYIDTSVDIIFTSHLIEHIGYYSGFKLLHECYRVLKNDGVLHIVFPDIDKIADVYHSIDINMIRNWMGIHENKMFLGSDQGSHKSMYNVNFLKILLWQTGFKYINEVEPCHSSCDEINILAMLHDGMPINGFINPKTIYISSYLDCRK